MWEAWDPDSVVLGRIAKSIGGYVVISPPLGGIYDIPDNALQGLIQAKQRQGASDAAE